MFLSICDFEDRSRWNPFAAFLFTILHFPPHGISLYLPFLSYPTSHGSHGGRSREGGLKRRRNRRRRRKGMIMRRGEGGGREGESGGGGGGWRSTKALNISDSVSKILSKKEIPLNFLKLLLCIHTFGRWVCLGLKPICNFSYFQGNIGPYF